jgi:ABC-type nitrate/sulfonate/bicarbonate transport system ATPase subunit
VTACSPGGRRPVGLFGRDAPKGRGLALLSDKQVLLLDEPFGAVDAITRLELQQWLAAVLAEEPRTVLLVTHDVEEALLLCERVVVLAGGRVVLELEVILARGAARRELVTSPAFP